MGYYERWFRRGYEHRWGHDTGTHGADRQVPRPGAGLRPRRVHRRRRRSTTSRPWVVREHHLDAPRAAALRHGQVRRRSATRWTASWSPPASRLAVGDTSRQRIRYDSGLTLWVNWRPEPWRSAGSKGAAKSARRFSFEFRTSCFGFSAAMGLPGPGAGNGGLARPCVTGRSPITPSAPSTSSPTRAPGSTMPYLQGGQGHRAAPALVQIPGRQPRPGHLRMDRQRHPGRRLPLLRPRREPARRGQPETSCSSRTTACPNRPASGAPAR